MISFGAQLASCGILFSNNNNNNSKKYFYYLLLFIFFQKLLKFFCFLKFYDIRSNWCVLYLLANRTELDRQTGVATVKVQSGRTKRPVASKRRRTVSCDDTFVLAHLAAFKKSAAAAAAAASDVLLAVIKSLRQTDTWHFGIFGIPPIRDVPRRCGRLAASLRQNDLRLTC